MKTSRNYLIYAVSLIVVFLTTTFVKNAQAEVVARLPNGIGNYIYFTDEVCVLKGKTFKDLARVYTKTETSVPIKGCYAVNQATQEVQVLWFEMDGQIVSTVERFYDIADLEFRNNGQAPQKQTSQPKLKEI